MNACALLRRQYTCAQGPRMACPIAGRRGTKMARCPKPRSSLLDPPPASATLSARQGAANSTGLQGGVLFACGQTPDRLRRA